MSDQAGFDLDLNAGGYIQQAGQALSTTTALEQSISRLAVTSGVMGRSWQQASPSRQHIAAFGAYTAAAAAQERALSGLAATQAVTGQSAERLGRGMRSLAREMPVGQRATQQTVETINQLGVAAAGQERKVVSLGRIVTQLQGANSGTFAPQLAQGMAQLERTFGDRGLDPKRVRDTGDALTTVSKQAGASAQGVLDFTNAIGPMAQAAGIGKTASLGIGASFSRIGQDGTAAAGAVNKMLSDMSKAVRDGGPEMATYADIVGTTADNFERLFKNNPAEALTRVTEAIGRNPTEGPRQLERLGLEGVRTQRALQAVSASGGLREQINTSLGAYGNDATKRASDAAFKGVLDNFQKAGTAAGQLSAAIGTPLLRPLGTFASLLAKVTSVGAGVADSGAGRTALAGAAYGGIGLLLARRVFGVGLGGAAVQQGLTSGPVSSALAGYRMGRGANVMRDEAGAITRVGGFLGRPAGAMARAAEEGRIGQGMLGGANQRIFGLARGAGERVGEMRTEQFGRARERMAARFGEGSAELAAWERTQAGGGPGMVSRISRGVRGTAGVVGAAYMRANAAQFAAANEMDPTQREGVVRGRLSFLGGNVGAFARGIPSDIRGAGSVGEAGSRLSSSFREMTNRIGETNRVLPNFTRGLSAFARMSMDSGSFMGRTAIGGARGLGRAGAGLMGALGGPWGLAITGGLALGSYALQQRSQGRQQRADEVQRQNDASPSAGIDRYNEAIGKATSSTSSFADAIQSSTRQISASVTDMSTATRIRPEDVAAAQQAPKPVTAYPAGSTPEQLSARIRQFAPGGLDPSQLNSIKVDLLRQFPQQVVDQTLGQLGPDAQAGGVAGQRQLSGAGDLSTLVRQAGDIPVDVSKGIDRNRISSQQYNSPFLQVPGGRYHLKQSQRDILDTASGSVSQRYTSQNEMFGSGFAQQQRLQDVNAAMMAAAQQGNEPVVDQLGQQFARQQLGIQNPPKISSDDIKKHGGYVQALAAKNQQFGGQLGSMTAPTAQGGQGISLTPGQGLAPTLQRSNLANQMQQFGAIAPFFDNTLQAPHGMGMGIYSPGQGPPQLQTSRAQNTVQQSLLQPDDLQKATDAVMAMVDASTKAGHSLTDLSTESGKAAAKIGDVTSPAYQRLLQTQDEAQFRQRGMAPFQSSGQNIGANMGLHMGMASLQGNTPDIQERRQQGREGLQQDMAALVDQLKARIAAERQYQIQRRRAQEDEAKQEQYAQQDFQTQARYAEQDYFKQRRYAQEDYQKQVHRSQRDFGRSRARAEEDYQLQVSRSYQDFYTQRSRQERDFNINLARMQEDYLTQRSRSIRDFNIQIGRQIEDQARTLYDPYQRIQTQAVWDAKQLMANLGEQNQAIARQKAQLDQVRRMGLSTDAIQSLGLNDPKNAQQLSKLVDDFMNDPKLVKQLNATAAQRMSISKLLVTDPSNKDLVRAREDFAKQLADMEADYRKMVSRARADMSKQLADQAADFARTMSRMAQDFARTMARNAEDFRISMADAAQDFATSMARQDDAYRTSVARSLEQFQRQMDRMREQYNVALTRMREDVTESEREIAGNLNDLWSTVSDLTKGKTADMNRVMRDGLQDTINFIKDKKNIDQINAAYKDLLPFDVSKMFTGGPSAGVGQGGGPSAGVGVSPHTGPLSTNQEGAGPVPGSLSRFLSGLGAGILPGRHGDVGWMGTVEAVRDMGFKFKMPTPGQTFSRGGTSEHAANRAVDFGDATSPSAAIARALVKYAVGPFAPIDELIFSPLGIGFKNGRNIGRAGYGDAVWNDHRDHVHVGTRPGVSLDNFVKGGSGGLAGMVGMFSDNKSGMHLGPWGAYLQVYEMLKTLNDQMSGLGGGIISGTVTGESQLAMARVIADVAKQKGLGRQGAELGIMTALAESSLRNLAGGDRDSIGLFQQRPSQGWGSPAQIHDPFYAASQFFNALPANWRGMAPWAAAQAVQRSAFSSGSNYRAQLGAADRILDQLHYQFANGGLALNGAVRGTMGESGPEAVVPLDHNGVRTLAQAIGAVISSDDLKGILTAGHQSPVTYVSQVHNEDHSVNFAGAQFDIVSNDPMDMANKAAARTRLDNLTGATQRRGRG